MLLSPYEDVTRILPPWQKDPTVRLPPAGLVEVKSMRCRSTHLSHSHMPIEVGMDTRPRPPVVDTQLSQTMDNTQVLEETVTQTPVDQMEVEQPADLPTKMMSP